MGSAPSKKTSPFQRKAHNFVIAVPDYSLYQINPDNSRHNMHLPGDVLCSIFRLISIQSLKECMGTCKSWRQTILQFENHFTTFSSRGLGTWVPKNHLEYSTKELSIETLNNLSTGVNWKSVVLESGLLNSSSTKPFCSAILQSKTITSLNLNSHDLDIVGGNAICELISTTTVLETVILRRINLTKVTTHLARSIRSNLSITRLELIQCDFAETQVTEIGEAFASLTNNIRHFAFKWHTGLTTLSYAWVTNCMAKPGLLSLNLKAVEGGQTFIDALVAGLRVNSTLRELRLSRNFFGRLQCDELLRTLTRVPIRVLSLSWNDFVDAHCPLLGELILQNENLTKLSLRCNRIFPPEVEALARTAAIREYQFVVKLNQLIT